MKSKPFAVLALSLAVLQLCLLPASWMLSVLLPESGVRSLLGSEGVRWMLGRFTDMLAGRPLSCLLLLS
ncbi:MAG: ABC transporter substrate-binding protein, partial [Prevotella sp.]|nr:ABC transporter substrate-binding protein [Prevotella sp.]